jgi:ubiquinone/menaquinone biosynthesis C-methylase UbiE
MVAIERPWFERALETGLRRLQLHRVPSVVYRISPGLGKVSVRIWYQHITRFDTQHDMTFMNYGFAGLDGAPPPVLLAQDERDRYCIQLYGHLTDGIELTGRDVLEVGSGRGGGCSYVARYRGPRSITGLDVARRAVDYCTTHHLTPNLRFVEGDAESLPFSGASFDAVINVESSHYYASVPRFLSEVRRVLRPGGFFLYTDFRAGRGLDILRRQVAGSGFEAVREELITANVLRALQLDEDRKLALINSKVPWMVRKVFKEFASTRGTATYESFRKRYWEYISFILRKPGA